MKEVKVFASLLVLLLGLTYWSTSDEEKPRTVQTASVFETDASNITGLRLVTRTQTVSMSFRKNEQQEKYPWIRIETKSSTRAFVANDKIEKLLKKYANFEAVRSLGSDFDEKALSQLKFDSPARKLSIQLKSGERKFELGGRTHGARDHYLRAVGNKEIFLMAKKTIADLESPESQLMLRKIIKVSLDDVASVLIKSGKKSRTILRQNRLSKKDAFWASSTAPEERNETLGNYVDKVLKLTVRKYGTKESPLPEGKLIAEVHWQNDSGKTLDKLSLYRSDEKRLSFLVRSDATQVPVEVSRSLGEQLERDLPVIFEP